MARLIGMGLKVCNQHIEVVESFPIEVRQFWGLCLYFLFQDSIATTLTDWYEHLCGLDAFKHLKEKPFVKIPSLNLF